jgi:hypothetical protein
MSFTNVMQAADVSPSVEPLQHIAGLRASHGG